MNKLIHPSGLKLLTWNGPLYNSMGHRLYFLNKIAVFFSEDHFSLSKQCRP